MMPQWCWTCLSGVGAVGVSGATSEQDAQVAKGGAEALTK
jgi:uncharacterized protein GlcG (DUF336 family)